MTLDYRFKTQLFWIVSRTNNCQYCLGHQESKLLGAGMKEDEIAALDGDWLAFSPAEQAAFRFARKFTFEPNRLADADIEALRAHYSDLQILEIVLSLAGNNSINRWKEGAGIPQSRDGGGFDRRRSGNPPADGQRAAHTYLTPTAEGLRDRITAVGPLDFDITTGKATRLAVFRRPPLEQREQVERALESARRRTPRLPLVEEAKAREALGKLWQDKPVPQWVRLLLNFPQDGRTRISSFIAANEQGGLSPQIKAQVAWVVARQDRAWYALGHAHKRLRELGLSDEQIDDLDRMAPGISPADRSLLIVARKLAAAPIVLTDNDVAEAVRLAGPRDVTQLISYTTSLAAFNRITEAAGLQLED